MWCECEWGVCEWEVCEWGGEWEVCEWGGDDVCASRECVSVVCVCVCGRKEWYIGARSIV